MEKKNNEMENYVKSIVTPIFEEALKETPKNPMSVGSGGSVSAPYCIYHPHNYRVYLDYDKSTFKPPKGGVPPSKTHKPTLGGSVVLTHRLKNSTEHEFDNFHGCRITIKKTQVEIQNKIDVEKKYRIDMGEEVEPQFREIIKQKDNECIDVLKKFIKEYGGTSKFEILNRHSENKIIAEDSIDRIKITNKWHTKISKKVYNENNVEFHDPAFASNYVDNRAIERISPFISQSLKENRELIEGVLKINAETSKTLNQFVKAVIPIQQDFAYNMKTHIAVLKGIKKGIAKLNKTLDKTTQKNLKQWC